eukprot:gene9525-1731_t
MEEWKQVNLKTPLPSLRTHSVVHYEPYLYMFGGWHNSEYHNDFIQYNILTKSWKYIQKDNEPKPRSNQTCVLLNIHQLVFFGGFNGFRMYNEVFGYDLKSEKWFESEQTKTNETNETLPLERDSHSAAVYNNKMIIFGGRGWNHTTEYLSDLYSLELKETENGAFSHEWTKLEQKGNLPSGRLLHSTIVFGDELILFGGRKKNQRFNELHFYNFTTAHWKKIICTDGPTKRTTRSGVLLRNSFVFFGGYDGDYCEDLWEFDLLQLKWKKMNCKNMPSARCAHVLCYDQRNLFIHGGEAFHFSSLNDLMVLNLKKKSFPDQIFDKISTENFCDCIFRTEPIYC